MSKKKNLITALKNILSVLGNETDVQKNNAVDIVNDIASQIEDNGVIKMDNNTTITKKIYGTINTGSKFTLPDELTVIQNVSATDTEIRSFVSEGYDVVFVLTHTNQYNTNTVYYAKIAKMSSANGYPVFFFDNHAIDVTQGSASIYKVYSIFRNAQGWSMIAQAEINPNIPQLPVATSEDEGKVPTVQEDGSYVLANAGGGSNKEFIVNFVYDNTNLTCDKTIDEINTALTNNSSVVGIFNKKTNTDPNNNTYHIYTNRDPITYTTLGSDTKTLSRFQFFDQDSNTPNSLKTYTLAYYMDEWHYSGRTISTTA